MLTKWEKEYWGSRIELNHLVDSFTVTTKIHLIDLFTDKELYVGSVADYLTHVISKEKFYVDAIDLDGSRLEIVVVG